MLAQVAQAIPVRCSEVDAGNVEFLEAQKRKPPTWRLFCGSD